MAFPPAMSHLFSPQPARLRRARRRAIKARSRRSSPLIVLEALEDRRLLSTYTVTSTLDDGSAGTLRSKIALANAAGGASTIDFSPTVFATPQTITLTSGVLTLSDTTGTETITGPAAGVTVNGNNASTVFDVGAGVTASISGLTITGGLGGGYGGGIENAGVATLTNCTISGNSAAFGGAGIGNPGTATLTDCTISGNTSPDGAGGGIESSGTATLTDCTISSNSASAGGGVLESAGMATLTDCTISGNSVGYGVGGIDINGTATLTDCTISDNASTVGLSGCGGIGNNGTATLTDCTISGNSAPDDGGGVFNSGTATLTDCTISGNSANAVSSSSGGGVFSSGITTLTNCTISSNSAPYGGGVETSEGTATLTDCTVSDNSGGGIGNDDTANLTLTDCTVSDNSSGFLGGGIENLGTATLSNCTLSGNSASDCGGALYDFRTATVSDCTISGNSAAEGGGVYSKNGGQPSYARAVVTLGNTIVAGNTASSGGPDVFGDITSQGHNLIGKTDGSSGWVGSDLTGTIASPESADLAPLADYGGPTQTMALLPDSPAIGAGSVALIPAGITTDQRGFARVVGGKVDIGADEIQSGPLVVNSTADSGLTPAGTLDLRAAVNLANALAGTETITFDPTVFASPQTITLTSGQLTLSDTTGTETITGPAAGVIISGGGSSRVFEVDASVTASISGLTIAGGNTNGYGGGLYDDGGMVTLTDCTVSGNTADDGGGLWAIYSGTVTLTNSTVSGNSAAVDGGGLYDAAGMVTLTDCTVSGNTADDGGGLWAAYGGTVTLTNSTVSGNSAGLGGGGLFSEHSTVTLTNSTVSGNSAVEGGGVDLSSAVATTVGNSIVAGNVATDVAPDVDGPVTSQGHNLIGATDSSSGWVASDLTGTVASPLVADLAPLGDYGGPTQTMALLPGSPAIDAGSNALIPGGVSTDQRGLARIVNGTVDIGAFESSGFTIAVTSGSGQSANSTEPFASPLVVTVTANNAIEPVTGAQVTFTAPGAGASASLSVYTATVAANGTATTTATANIAAGSYTVTATATGVTGLASFSLTNVASLVVNSTSDAAYTAAGVNTLRLAIAYANSFASGNPTITFDPTVFATPQTITLTQGQLTLTDTTGTETITGPAAGVTIDANHASRVLEVDASVTASLTVLTITGGGATDYGGGLYNMGNVTLTNVTVSGNSAFGGGGVFTVSGGTTMLTEAVVTGNTASNVGSGGGGGLFTASGGTTTLNFTTVSNNYGHIAGGGLDNDGTTTLTNCTVSGNHANNNGGGLYTSAGITTLTNCTFSGDLGGSGGGLSNNGGTITLTDCTFSANQGANGCIDNAAGTVAIGNTMVAGNTGSGTGLDVGGTFTSLGHNLIGETDGSTGWVASDLTGTVASPLDADLASLGDYSGPTQTMALLPGSPAIRAGVTVGSVITDQRGAPRGSVVDIGAFQTTLEVESASGSVDTSAAGLTLPGPVALADQFAGSTIIFDPMVFSTPKTITLTASLELSNTLLTTTINGPTAGVTASGGDAVRVFQVDNDVSATVSGLTISGGSTTGDGGGVNNDGGTITLTDCTITGNSAADGGGLYNSKSGAAYITSSYLSGNSASAGGAVCNEGGTIALTGVIISGNSAAEGGGVFLADARGTSTITTCTVTGNSAAKGGGLYSAGAGPSVTGTTVSSNTASTGGGLYIGTGQAPAMTTIANCTVSGNSAATGGGIQNASSVNILASTIAANAAASGGGLANGTGGQAMLEDTIVATNVAPGGTASDVGGSDAAGVDGTYDLVGAGVAGGIAGGTGDKVLASDNSAELGSLGDYGGSAATVPLLPGSPALDTGIAIAGLSTDERGLAPTSANPDIGAFQSQGFTIAVVAGTPQVGAVDANFTIPLEVVATPVNPKEPVAGGIVDFSANPSPSGASATLSPASATIGANGTAQVTATANSIVGAYTVTASARGFTSTASFNLKNLLPLTFSGIVSQSIAWGSSTATLAGNLADGSQAPVGQDVAVTLDGVTQQAVIASSGNFSVTFAISGLPISTTPYTLTYAYPSDGITFLSASTTSSLTITKATPIVTWATPADITYGTALRATDLDASAAWTVFGVNGSVAGSFSYSPATGTVLHAGSGQTLTVVFTPTDTTHYTAASDSVTINVDQATPNIAWATPAPIIYGTALSVAQLDAASSWTVGGVKGPVAGSFTYTPALGTVLQAGDQTLSVSFTPTDSTDYATATGTVTIDVDQATPDVDWISPASITYGTALSTAQLDAASSWTVGGVNGAVAGSFTYTPGLGAILQGGGQTLSVSFTPTDSTDYKIATDTVTIDVARAIPSMTWAAPGQITYGTALSATELDAAAAWRVAGANGPVAGSFTYSPAPGTVLHAGSDQTLSVSFTPTDSTDYTTASATATINVAQATPSMTWARPAPITYGTALSAAQLDASSSWTVAGANGPVAGTFTYNAVMGSILPAGEQTLSVTFTPADSTDYTAATNTVALVVDRATPQMSWATPARITYGTALSSTQLDATSAWTVAGASGPVAGSFTYTPAAGTVLPVGEQSLSVVFTPTDTTDYSIGTDTVTIDVAQATPNVEWINPDSITYGMMLSAAQLDATAGWSVGGVNGPVAGSFTYTPAAGTVLPVGEQSLSVVFTPTDTTDYTSASVPEKIDVLKATPEITWADPADITYGTALSAAQLDATASGVNGPVAGSLTYSQPLGTILPAGSDQTLSVTFTPTDSADYTTATATTTIDVARATPDINWSSPANLLYGTPLSSTQLDATAGWTVGGVDESVAGSFTYTPAAGTVLPAGTAQPLSVAFVPSDSADFNPASAMTPVTVVPDADLTVTIAGPPTGLVGKDLVYTVTTTNNGPSPATGVVVTDTPPPAPAATFVSTSTGASPDSTGTIAFGPVDLAVGASISYVITLKPTMAAVAGPPLLDAASVNASDLESSSSSSNSTSSAQASTPITIPVDLAITQFTASESTSQIGDALTYAIGVTNGGPNAATGVTVTSPLGTGASYVAGSATASSGSASLQGSTLVASLGTLAPGASATVTFAATPGLIGTLTGSATVTPGASDTDTMNNLATLSTAVVDRVGTIELAQTAYTVTENAGSATITVNRVDGTRGTVTVDYSTVAINATPGLDYTPVSGTLTFPAGVTSQTIVVPVLPDPYDDHNELVSVVLSNPQTTETLGQPLLGTSAATLTIEDTDPNNSPLTVSNVQWVGTTQGITQILVAFNKALIPSTALDLANYALAEVGRAGNVTMSVSMEGTSDLTVVLTPAQPLAANRFYDLAISGGSGGIEDVGGNMLSGDGSHAGTSYAALLGEGTSLKYTTAAGDRVSLRLTGGGMFEDLLNDTGQGQRLTVVGEVPHRTVLSGKVRGGTGQAYLGPTIYGLGTFGDVRVKLSSPHFVIGQYPFSAGSGASDAQAGSSVAVVHRPTHRGRTNSAERNMNRPFHAFRR